MTINEWFFLLTTLALAFSALLLLDAAHRAHIAEIRRFHAAELNGLRAYIRTLNRERKWLEAELAKAKARMSRQSDVPVDPVHIQWLPPSEEYGEDG